jgi:hypothetical protein
MKTTSQASFFAVGNPVLRWPGILFLYLIPAGYLAYLKAHHLPLFSSHPIVNLTLRLLMMDLLPILWVLPLLGWKIHPEREWPRNFTVNLRRKPVPFAAPVLAVILFFHQSFFAVVDPSSAGPTPLGAVLLMEAATALLTAVVLFYGVGARSAGKRAGGRKYPDWVGWILFGLLAGGGLAFFLWTLCDISRLLIFLCLGSLAFQGLLESRRSPSDL